MKVTRKITIETNDIQIGDCIQVGHYTATCQKIIGNDMALFILDQYLDKAMYMNKIPTNEGGYKESDLRKELNSENILKDFSKLELVRFENGDLLRLPFYGEIFGHDKWYTSGAVEPDDCEQFELIKKRSERNSEPEWGWLQNIHKRTKTHFCAINHYGAYRKWYATHYLGARPIFQIKIER